MKPDYPIRFGKYFLLNRLAVGGMAEVYRAKLIGPKGFEKKLAIKKILPEFSYDEEFVQMFVDEARISSHLHHPNIVPVFDFGQVNQQYYIAMELVEGTNLKNLFFRSLKQEKVLSKPLVYFMVSKIASALEYAHRVQIEGQEGQLKLVHRDVSPQNILISRRGEVKITDFGIAKAAIRLTQTQPGKIQGKYSYMSPEQALGRNIDHRSDIFSLGIIFFELLTGKKVYGSKDSVERYKQATKAKIPRLNNILPNLPTQVDQLVTRMLSKGANQRPDRCADIVQTLSEFMPQHPDDGLMRELGTLTSELFPITEQERQADQNIPYTPNIQSIDLEKSSPDDGLVFEDQSFHPDDPLEQKERTERPFKMKAWLTYHPTRLLAAAFALTISSWAIWGMVQGDHEVADDLKPPAETSKPQSPPEDPEQTPEPIKKTATELETELIDIERQIEFVENEIKMVTAPPAPTLKKPKAKAIARACPNNMVRIKAGSFVQGSNTNDPARQELLERPQANVSYKTFCIDRYEYPNKKGQAPQKAVTYQTALGLCQKAGKKICTEKQWERACKGPGSVTNNIQFPYGKTFSQTHCNIFKRNLEGTKDYKPPVAGGFGSCKSPEGVFDLSGGVAEWTSTQGLLSPQAHITKGGSFKTGRYPSRCSSIREESGPSDDLGFRCCK